MSAEQSSAITAVRVIEVSFDLAGWAEGIGYQICGLVSFGSSSIFRCRKLGTQWVRTCAIHESMKMFIARDEVGNYGTSYSAEEGRRDHDTRFGEIRR